jgi:hypothetical protein
MSTSDRAGAGHVRGPTTNAGIDAALLGSLAVLARDADA